MKDVSKETMVQLVTFIYTGEVNVPPESMTEFLKTAEALKIKVMRVVMMEIKRLILNTTNLWQSAQNRMKV